jgi:hypothetical protein
MPTQTQNKRMHTPNIHAFSGIRTHDPASERAKTVHALDLVTIVTGTITHTSVLILLASTIRFLAKDINTGTITVSLSYTLQISLYYGTRKVFSSEPDCQLSPNSLAPFFYYHLARSEQETSFLAISLLLLAYPLPRELVCRAVA